MALPIPSNTTCDVFRLGGGPPSAPDVTGVPCVLLPYYERGQELLDRGTTDLIVTHKLLVDVDVDIRDDWDFSAITNNDAVWVPDQNGTKFSVIFVERVGRGTAADHRRCFLRRENPTWPTSEL